MKTLILTTAMVVLTTLSFSQNELAAKSNDYVLNSEDLTVAMFANSEDQVTMILLKNPETVVKLKVKSENNRVLYTKRFKKADKSHVRYDISEFPTGEYTFEIVKDKDVLYSQKFAKRDSALAIAN